MINEMDFHNYDVEVPENQKDLANFLGAILSPLLIKDERTVVQCIYLRKRYSSSGLIS